MDATQEEWRPVVGYEGYYEVSNLGMVRGAKRRGSSGAPLKPHVNRNGHQTVKLSMAMARRTRYVHHLVLAAFVGARHEDAITRHLNGIPSDNRVENLRWGNAAENAADSLRHGTHANLRKTHCNYGHEYTPENTYIQPSNGSRRCRVCMHEYNQRRVR